MRRLRRRAGEGPRDGGFALVTVLGTMVVLSLFVLGATVLAANTIPNSRRAQDYAAALAAAQTGVDDVLSRLNNCDGYWAAPCPTSPPEPARWDGNPDGSQTDRWATVPGSTGTFPARYRYTLVSTPATTPGLIRVRADGEVNGVRRTVTADLRKRGFLDFIYYTDKESSSPAVVRELYPPRTQYWTPFNGRHYYYEFEGVTASQANRCGRYYYSVPPASGARQNYTETYRIYSVDSTGGDRRLYAGPDTVTRSCDINFVGGDEIRGPLYTNDAMLLMRYDGKLPLFKGPTETFWQPSYSPAAPASAPYRKNGADAAPDPAGYAPTLAETKIDMPATNGALRDRAVSDGCVYTGPTRIKLNSNGTMDVTSPRTPAGPHPCGVGTGRPLPDNGVVYVDAFGGSCSGKPTAFPLRADDVTPYSCKAGDVFLEGTLKGRLTIGTAGDVIVTGDVTYSRQVWDEASERIDLTVTDVLGLVAQGSVKVYHPVTCTSAPLGLDCDAFSNLPGTKQDVTIEAAILSVDNSFTVQNYHRGQRLGELRVRGGIYQRHRGAVGTSGGSGTGYLKDYVYDTRLVSLPPPHFLEPTSSAWQVVGFSE